MCAHHRSQPAGMTGVESEATRAQFQLKISLMPNYGLFFMKTYLLHPDICGHHLILLILVYYEAKWDIHVKESNKRRGVNLHWAYVCTFLKQLTTSFTASSIKVDWQMSIHFCKIKMLLHWSASETHHINELSNGQAKVDQNHIWDVCYRTRELVVVAEQRPEESFFRMGTSRTGGKHCREDKK